jgi:hypothetical protein
LANLESTSLHQIFVFDLRFSSVDVDFHISPNDHS